MVLLHPQRIPTEVVSLATTVKLKEVANVEEEKVVKEEAKVVKEEILAVPIVTG
jgi:hypothetical protein